MADEIVVRIRAEGQDKFVKELKKAGIAVEETGDKVEETTKKSEDSFKRLGKTIGAALATGAIIEFGRVLVKTAIDIDATNKKIQTVFGDSAKAVEDFARTSATSLGLTVNQYKRAASAVGDLLIPIGFQRKEAAQLSNELVKLSGALAAWTGGQLNATQVSEILTKALLGEREQLKQLGVQISEADVKAELLRKGQEKLTGAALAQAKALASLELITAKSADAQAAFGDDTTTLAEATLELNAQVLELRDNLAEGLIPVLTDVVEIVNNSVEGWRTFFSFFDGVPKVVKEARELTSEELNEAVNEQREALEGLTEGSLKYLKVQNRLRAFEAEQARRFRETASRRGGGLVPDPEEVEEGTKKVEEATETLFIFVDALNEAFTTDPVNALAGDIEQNLIPVVLRAAQTLSGLSNELAIPENFEQIQTDAVKANTEARIKFAQMERDEKIEAGLEYATIAGDLTSQLTGTFQQLQEIQLQSLQRKFQQGLISEQEFQDARAELLKKSAVANKANAVFDVGLNTARAVTNALATPIPFPGPQILAALVTGLAAAQLSAVLRTPIPQFAEGTKGRKKAPKGMAWVGEEGPELVMMKGGENIFTAQDSEALMKLLGSYGVPVQFKTPYEELYKPMTAMHELTKSGPLEGIDFNPLIHTNVKNRMSLGKKLDRINDTLVKMGTGRRMTKN